MSTIGCNKGFCSAECTKGLWKENPIFRLVLGMCSTLAITTEAINGIGMGLAVTFVLVGSNLMISALRKIIPDKVRIPAFIVIIASFVTIVELVMQAYFPSINKALGIFIPLIVVNCIIFARAEAFAFKNPLAPSLIDGVSMGIGYTLSLIVVGSLREVLGNGTIFGVSVFGNGYQPFLIMIMPAGAFICLGVMLALMNKIEYKRC
ncbi:MAG: electron transport complex subunit E [bacterium]